MWRHGGADGPTHGVAARGEALGEVGATCGAELRAPPKVNKHFSFESWKRTSAFLGHFRASSLGREAASGHSSVDGPLALPLGIRWIPTRSSSGLVTQEVRQHMADQGFLKELERLQQLLGIGTHAHGTHLGIKLNWSSIRSVNDSQVH